MVRAETEAVAAMLIDMKFGGQSSFGPGVEYLDALFGRQLRIVLSGGDKERW